MFCVILLSAVAVVEFLTYFSYKRNKGSLMGLYHIHVVTTFAWLSLFVFDIMTGFHDLSLKNVWMVLFVPTMFVSLLSGMGLIDAPSKGIDGNKAFGRCNGSCRTRVASTATDSGGST
ncbi:MAG: hypothetical protein AAB632_03205 [Patescibacteria group bacterium]